MTRRAFVTAQILFALVPAVALAALPRIVSYQGVLTDDLGNPRKDGRYAVTFHIYDAATGGTPVWTEEDSVTTRAGMFTVELGDRTALSLQFDRPYWLAVRIGGEELAPRTRLTAGAYALRAARSDSADVATRAQSAATHILNASCQ